MGKLFENIEIICICPVKNEAWVIGFFCQNAKVWADYIVILDQGSTDETVRIASKTPNVVVINNPSKKYNEGERQKILIDAARKLSPKQLLIVALDADEFLDPNFPSEREREIISTSAPGTIIQFSWFQVNKEGTKAFEVRNTPFAYLDDGAGHCPSHIHSIPCPHPLGQIM